MSALKARIEKSADAYRSIGEAAAELGLETHVLRYWETRFPR
ncbi:MAG: MerR family transcriptional regulator, partial [Hyphomonas sp.]